MKGMHLLTHGSASPKSGSVWLGLCSGSHKPHSKVTAEPYSGSSGEQSASKCIQGIGRIQLSVSRGPGFGFLVGCHLEPLRATSGGWHPFSCGGSTSNHKDTSDPPCSSNCSDYLFCHQPEKILIGSGQPAYFLFLNVT